MLSTLHGSHSPIGIKKNAAQTGLNWRKVGASYWPDYQASIQATNATATFSFNLQNITSPHWEGMYPVLMENGLVYLLPQGNTTKGYLFDYKTSSISQAGGNLASGSNKYSGGVLLHDGRVFCVPYTATTARIYDPVANTVVIPNGTYPSGYSFKGGVLLPDGRVFCIPYNATQARIYDPVADTVTIPNGTYPGNYSFSGGALLPDGRVYCAPEGSTTARIYDPVSDTLTIPNGTFPVNSSSGAVLLPNGQVYCVPYNVTNARIYDPVTNTLAVKNSFARTYHSGKLLPNGYVFCVPDSGEYVRICDPYGLTHKGPQLSTVSKWQGSVLLPDGRVLCTPTYNYPIAIYGIAQTSYNINVLLSAYYNKY